MEPATALTNGLPPDDRERVYAEIKGHLEGLISV